MRRPIARTGANGFTLVELLVVVAIIGLLIGILVPALGAAREQAQIVASMSDHRQLATATNSYLAENNGVTPAGHYNNFGGNFGPWETSVGALLQPYLATNPEEFFRDPAAEGPDDAYQITGDNPYDGTDDDDVFSPNYFYMAVPWVLGTAEPLWFEGNMWGTRNMANVPVSSVPRQSASDLVVWVDESTSQKTGTTDIYERNQAGERAEDTPVFSFVDGHAEIQRFDDLRGYFEALHDPIPQTNRAIDFSGNFEPRVDYTEHPNWDKRFDFPEDL